MIPPQIQGDRRWGLKQKWSPFCFACAVSPILRGIISGYLRWLESAGKLIGGGTVSFVTSG